MQEIELAGHEVVYMQHENAQLPVSPSEIRAVLCNSLFDYHPVKLFTSLEFVQATSAGLDRLPLRELKDREVIVKRASGVYSPAIAEFVVLLILQIYKKSWSISANQRNHTWKKERDLRELTNRTACIFGFGSIGREIAARLKPFGINIRAIGRATQSSVIDQEIATADILVLSLPLTDETIRIMDLRRLASMREDSVIINISRGQLIDQNALIKLLDEGMFLGVGLDVFESEPLDSASALWDYERVFVSSHNSFVSDKSSDRLASLFLKGVGEFL